MAQKPSYDYLFKLLLIGDASVGKSSLLLRFTDDTFDQHLQSTIGVDFKVKHLTLNGTKLKLTIWDTAGQERFRTLTSSYYRGAQGVLMVYDVTKRESFCNLRNWLEEVRVYSSTANGSTVVKVLVGNKLDMLAPDCGGTGTAERAVPKEEAEKYAEENGMMFLETSAKSNEFVKEAFTELVAKILEDPDLISNATPGKPRMVIKPADPDARIGQGGCC